MSGIEGRRDGEALEREVERRVERKIADMRQEELIELLETTVTRLDRIADRLESSFGEGKQDD